MAKRTPPWYVRRNAPPFRYALFIAHVAEDAGAVAQLKAEIDAYSGRGGRAPLSCFLDVHNWPIGNVNTAAIRENLLQSAHLVAWISPIYLATQRGWVWVELAYAELIELSMNLGKFGVRHPYLVPVFKGVTLAQVERTPWLAYWERKLLLPDQDHPTAELARKRVDFYEQEVLKQQLPSGD